MTRRLAPQNGEWIDRQKPLEFRFEGETYSGFAGDLVSTALWANDVRLQGRSFKYHRPRGIFSLAGTDANVVVEDSDRTNLRGDLLPLESGMDLRAVNTRGSLRRDRLRFVEWFSRFLPVGFYYKAFHTPRRLFPFYENQMRKVAGLGAIRPHHRSAASPKEYDFCDVAVVGSGPAGLSAAITAAQSGSDVLLIDEQPRIGGSFHWQWTHEHGKLVELLQTAESLPNLRVRTATQVGGYYADHWLALIDETRLTKLRANAVVVATGCFEQPAVFQNNDLPGVLLSTAAQKLIHQYAIKPLDRAVVLAANDTGYLVASELRTAGVEIVAIIDPRPEGTSAHHAEQLKADGVRVLNDSILADSIPGSGKACITGATAARTNGGAREQFACDGVVMSVGWTPSAALLYQAGTRMRYAQNVEQFIPDQLPAGIFATGRVNGVFELEQQLADGVRAGKAAAAHLGQEAIEADPIVHTGSSPSHPYPITEDQRKKNFVDLDEDLHLTDFVNAHQEGYDNIELMKRYTTVGMGPSQGKHANMNAVRVLAKLNGDSIDETGSTTSRPFHQPVSIAHLAGRRFHPQRQTPLHDWHTEHDAEMIHAGAWFRPEFYRRKGASRESCILEEAKSVREQVGLIDVCTLGKLRIKGPDAVRFLELIYTGRFTRHKIGRLRYGVACDESGVIIEDGLLVRLAEDDFYLTATSAGVARFYRDMQRWQLIYGMDVTLLNATGHMGAMNLAGPKSRQVLQKVCDDSLSAADFPYFASRQLTIADVPAIVLRVGFVGELGFEIHVPASQTSHVWHHLMSCGAEHEIRPFGVEAQRLLRLEKGHLIVGQDTDALAYPAEADLEWAIGKNKTMFVGSRSLEILNKKELTRKLVGVKFEASQPTQLPEENNLFIHEGEIAGRITSIGKASTLGYPIALAYVQPDLAAVGTRLQVRLGNGQLVDCQVAALPFYDSENERQEIV